MVYKCCKCVCSISFSTFLMVFKCYKCVCSISFSTFLSFLIIGCFYTRVLEFEGALHRKRIPYSMQSNLVSTPLFLKLKKIQGLFKEKWNSRTFQGLPLKFKDFSRLCEPCIKFSSTRLYTSVKRGTERVKVSCPRTQHSDQ